MYNYGTNALLNDIAVMRIITIVRWFHLSPSRFVRGAPELHYGYMTLIGMTLISRLFQKVIKPKLDEWDRRFSLTDADLAFMRANGIPCAER